MNEQKVYSMLFGLFIVSTRSSPPWMMIFTDFPACLESIPSRSLGHAFTPISSNFRHLYPNSYPLLGHERPHYPLVPYLHHVRARRVAFKLFRLALSAASWRRLLI